MADFKEAFDKTIGHEGGWNHRASDRGGETYKGIARRYHAESKVWRYIDLAKQSENFPKNINHRRLEKYVEDFYRTEFWNPIKGFLIPDQDIANMVFDVAVNGGVTRASKYFQQILNVLNRRGLDYPDLKVDGILGPKSITTLKLYLYRRDRLVFLVFYGAKMVNHWLDFAKDNEDQEESINGIGNRWVTILKDIAGKL